MPTLYQDHTLFAVIFHSKLLLVAQAVLEIIVLFHLLTRLLVH